MLRRGKAAQFWIHVWAFLSRAAINMFGLLGLLDLLVQLAIRKYELAKGLEAAMSESLILVLLLCWVLAAVKASWELRRKDRDDRSRELRKERRGKDRLRGTIRHLEEGRDEAVESAVSKIKAETEDKTTRLSAEIDKLRGDQAHVRMVLDLRRQFVELRVSIEKAHEGQPQANPISEDEREQLLGLLGEYKSKAEGWPKLEHMADQAEEEVRFAETTARVNTNHHLEQIEGILGHYIYNLPAL
ncbi:MAG: hypothetical protein O7H41_15925 [Planctomycetota bacterium]|nr:hypothetical protein [Planctomycetota bacterium]